METKNESLDEDFSEIQESDDTDWKVETSNVREKAIRQREKTKALRKALDERDAKIAELEKPKSEKKAEKSDDELLKRLDKLALKTSGINEADEVELFEKWKTDTGRDSDSIVENNIFKKELEDLRTAKANQKATSNVRGETGGSEIKNDPDYWIAKATKNPDGSMNFPEEMPKELYTKVLDKVLGNSEQSGKPSDLKFYNK